MLVSVAGNYENNEAAWEIHRRKHTGSAAFLRIICFAALLTKSGDRAFNMLLFPQDIMSMENKEPTYKWLGTRRGQTGLAELENELSLFPISVTKSTNLCGSNSLWFLLVFCSALVCSGAAVRIRSRKRHDLQPSRDDFEQWQCCYKQNTMRCSDVMKCPCCLRPKRRTCDTLIISTWVLVSSLIAWVSSAFNRKAHHVSECFSF